jgi:predicted GIY-YIG superfamily endonuclease
MVMKTFLIFALNKLSSYNIYRNIMIKIYKILDLTNNNCYIGSTSNLLSSRLWKHKNCNTTSSEQIIKNNNYEVSILEQFEDHSIRYDREKYYINTVKNCINKNRLTGVYSQKKRDYDKKYVLNRYYIDKSWGGLNLIDKNIFN